jgi:hypothetical protein
MKKQIVKKRLMLASETLSRMQLARVAGGDGSPNFAFSDPVDGCPNFAVTHAVDGCPLFSGAGTCAAETCPR